MNKESAFYRASRKIRARQAQVMEAVYFCEAKDIADRATRCEQFCAKRKGDKLLRGAPKFFIISSFCLIFSCATMADAQKRLDPPVSTSEVRIGDIEKIVDEKPADAIQLIEIYKEVYIKGDDENANITKLESLRKTAINNMITIQRDAINEKRWDDAASLARSLGVLGISVDKTGKEPLFLLEEAKDFLANGKDLQGFLSAVHSNELEPLSKEDATFFLESACKKKQRRTANYFLAAALNAGAELSPEIIKFAEGHDTAADMIKGVATVLVDRGIKVERGRGMADRILGSAFFVDASGLLITNYHVIASEVDPSYEGYSRMYIRMGDSTSARVPAKVIGWDKTMDLAVIKAEIKPEYVFSVVDNVNPSVGDTVLAIGSPGGLEKTVTSGIVSALGRRFLQIGDVIQIDAAVNHGNSGGPVIDSSGRLVGIVFAGVEQFEGLNFAVPAVRLAAALPAMLKGGKAKRPWLGLTLAQNREGAEIIYVAPLTPAANQLVSEGEYIKKINGLMPPASQGQLIAALQDILFPCEPGELVSLVTGNGKTRIIQTVERPETPLAEAAKKDSRERLAAALFGLILEPSVGRSIMPIYLVKGVVRGSIADEAGLSAQDPVRINKLTVEEKEGYALLDIDVKKRASGYIETSMRLPATLDSPDTL
jgi:S1-C subfamily serine protease